MICRDTNIGRALRHKQRGFLLNPYRFGTGYQSVVASQTPSLWWRMDAASGNVTDSSGNSRTGVATATLTYAQAGLSTYTDGQSIDSNKSGYLDVADFLGSTYTGNGFSIDCLFELDTLPTGGDYHGLCGRNGATNAWSMILRVGDTGEIEIRIVTMSGGGASRNAISAASVIAASTPYYVQAAWQPTVGLSLYVNGTSVASASFAQTTLRDDTTNKITALNALGYIIDGKMDEFVFWNHHQYGTNATLRNARMDALADL